MDEPKTRYRLANHSSTRPSKTDNNASFSQQKPRSVVPAPEWYIPFLGKNKKSNKILYAGIFLLLAIAVVLGFLIYLKLSHPDLVTIINNPGTTADLSSSTATKQNTQDNQTTNKSGQSVKSKSTTPSPPNFIVYYPSNLDPEMQVDKSSIAYSKDSFSFTVEQAGQKSFFVNEQPAEANFSYQRLKVRLNNPTEINTALGKGVLGTISTGLITTVKSDKNTLIIINCTALQCAAPSLSLIAAMQINDNPTKIH
ncbi:MAG TPA: hypothetical protein VLF88_03255 [Candidatus Babeliales bacterium]|nr:hypothetical protein [Candidatus Babeliales bacterium]